MNRMRRIQPWCDVAMGTMPAAWLSVAAADAVVALVQIAGLRAGWWREDRPR